MVKLSRVRKENRTRDAKRNRFVLAFGKHRIFHVTNEELSKLVNRALRYQEIKEQVDMKHRQDLTSTYYPR